jgi:hypothetical protein
MSLFLIKIGSLLLTFLGMILVSFKHGRDSEKNKQQKEELKSVKSARKVESENSNLTRDELIDSKL